MSRGWIDAAAVMEPADARAFERALERHVSGLDVTHRMGECMGVALATEEDEVVFRLYLLCERTIAGICRVAARTYILAAGLRGEVDRCLAGGAFDGTAAPLVAAGLELRDEGVLRRLAAALDAERPSFADGPPVLCPV